MQGVVLWGAASWNLTGREVGLLDKEQNMMLLTILQLPRLWEEPFWQYRLRAARRAKQILAERNIAHISNKAFERQWSWAGHLMRMDPQRIVTQVVTYKGILWRLAARSRYQGHPRGGFFRRWEDKLEEFCQHRFFDHWVCVGKRVSTDQWNSHAQAFAEFARQPGLRAAARL
jgi:hypothetical protein